MELLPPGAQQRYRKAWCLSCTYTDKSMRGGGHPLCAAKGLEWPVCSFRCTFEAGLGQSDSFFDL